MSPKSKSKSKSKTRKIVTEDKDPDGYLMIRIRRDDYDFLESIHRQWTARQFQPLHTIHSATEFNVGDNKFLLCVQDAVRLRDKLLEAYPLLPEITMVDFEAVKNRVE